MPTALTTLYCTRADIEAVLSVVGVTFRLDDDGRGTENATETAYLATQGLNWAAAQVNLYLLGRYTPAELAKSWAVNEWAADFGALFCCRRRVNPLPKSLIERCGERTPVGAETGHYGVMAAVMRHEMDLADIADRMTDTPAWSNVRVDPLYQTKQIRVERSISEKTPRAVSPAVDWPSEYGDYGDR